MKSHIQFFAGLWVVFLNYSFRNFQNIENIEPFSDQSREAFLLVKFEKFVLRDEVNSIPANDRTLFLYFS
ncbi:hypothetical protein [Rhodonellum sp.]|uniref:hypothetical protein n=1 Tax=Rhodonellum sp. TaxID=2231180 RepID=UPI00272A5A21|nr:hypothetical protein [Rhodonellum sp.]